MSKLHNTVIRNIEEQFDRLFPAERKVAQYIMDHMQEVVNLTVSELSQRTNTSEATVVRASKHLGYDGYYQMRLLLSKDVGKYELVETSDDTLTSSQKIFTLEAERINKLAETIDFSQLIELAKTLIASNTIHIVAVGNTIPVSMDLGFRLERAGLSCTYSILFEHYYNHIMLGSSGDTLIAISRSGASTQVIRAVELAHKKNMKIIVITGELNHALTHCADHIIKINEMKTEAATISKPDSHLQEFAINDAILYVVRSILTVSANSDTTGLEDKDNIGILLSEFKQ